MPRPFRLVTAPASMLALGLVVAGSISLVAQAQRDRGRMPRASRPSASTSTPAALPPSAAIPAPQQQTAETLAAPLPGARSPRNANYSIDASLDTSRHIVTGRETITWRNITPVTTDVLRVHLYWNAWKNSRSTWLRERALAGGASLSDRGEDDWGWTDIRTIRLLEGGATPFVDLTSRRRFIAPDDGNQDDETLMEVMLPAAVAPGQTITLEVEWQAKVPRTFARTGRIGDFYFVAQWFPKVGVLEADGWKAHQFHAGTEFFADYGVYDVRLRTPTGWTVGATGVEREARDNGDGTTTHRFVQDDVHDFAWTTSPDMIERKARFEHAGLPPVDMRLLLQPEHEHQAERHFAATGAALRYYGQWYGPYPYGHLTIVDPAWQSGAGGMEYPTLFTAGTRWLVAEGVTQPEGVTVHECGHQFWYAIVGNNEFEYAWLDEGLNTFSTARTIEQAFSPNYYSQRFFRGFVPWVYRDITLSRATDGNGLSSYRSAAESDAQSTPSWRYSPSTGSRITYNKTALWLNTLERMIGWPTLQRVMSTFFRRYQFKHPRPQDFFSVANEVSGRDLTWFFDQVYRSSNTFDYAVDDLQSRRAAPRGMVDRDGRREFSTGEAGQGSFETTTIVRRLGEAVFPVDVLVTFENGEQVREHWDGRDRWRAFTWTKPSRAVSAQVDPEHVLLLDVNYMNNSRTLDPRADDAATNWSLRWLVWMQDLLMTGGMFF